MIVVGESLIHRQVVYKTEGFNRVETPRLTFLASLVSPPKTDTAHCQLPDAGTGTLLEHHQR